MNTFSAQRSFCFVLAWCMQCGLCHTGRGFYVILALLAAFHTSTHPPRLMLVCLCVGPYKYSVCVHELLNPSCFSWPLSPSFSALLFLSSPACTPIIHSQAQEMKPPKNATQVGCLAKALEGRVCLCRKIEELHLFCCDVHNLNRERSVESKNESLERGWERREERGKEDERARERKWRKQSEREWMRFVCLCIYGGGALALRVPSIPFSSSYSWEI